MPGVILEAFPREPAPISGPPDPSAPITNGEREEWRQREAENPEAAAGAMLDLWAAVARQAVKDGDMRAVHRIASLIGADAEQIENELRRQGEHP